MIEHPEHAQLAERLQKLASSPLAFKQYAFRIVNPRFCKEADIINGEGGMRASGRWNLRGAFRCTYASYSIELALQESLAAVRRKGLPDQKALPRTIVAIAVDLKKVLPLSDGQVRQRLRVSEQRMSEERWWIENLHNREALTQALGAAAFHAGFEAIIVPSAITTRESNIVVFPDNLLSGSSFTVATPIRT